MCVADAYTRYPPRVFRDALTPIEAFLELERCSDAQSDRRAVAAVERVLAVHRSVSLTYLGASLYDPKVVTTAEAQADQGYSKEGA